MSPPGEALDLIPVQLAITSSGVAIGRAPLTGVPRSHSVILYCRERGNIDRMIASVRAEFANGPIPATLSVVVLAVLSSAAIFGIGILTELEAGMIALEVVSQTEAELARVQSFDGLSAINRTVQNDVAGARTKITTWHEAILSWLDSLDCRDKGATNLCPLDDVSALAATLSQSGDHVDKWVQQSEQLSIALLRHVLGNMRR
jgi:hypothetical protein